MNSECGEVKLDIKPIVFSILIIVPGQETITLTTNSTTTVQGIKEK